MFTSRLLVALCALAITGWAQPSAGVTGPVTGFIFGGASGTIRPMLGIPGAAYLGGALATGLENASIAPDGSAAVAVQQSGKLMVYTGLRNGGSAAAGVTGGISGADLMAFSPDSSAAAVYSSSSRQGQMLSGMAKLPGAGPAIDLSALPGQVTALSCDGQRLILGVSGDSGGIFVASPSAGAVRVAAASNPAAIALAGASLYFADSQAQQIWQVESYAASPAAVIFANDNAVDSPAGLQLSADGQRLFVANAGNRKLTVYDIASRTIAQSLDLPFVPTRMDRIGDPAVFLLNGGGQGPIYVLRDAGAGKAAVFFVPVPLQKRPPKTPVHPV